jgi:hypothetical protein
MENQFDKFAGSKFNLFIYSGNKLIFKSKKKGIKGLVFFIKKNGKSFKNLTVYDTKIGNAVALLCAYLKVKEIYSLVGSKLAAKTLKKFKIKYHFKKTIVSILNRKGTDICPMEKMSLNKTPGEFCRQFVK